MNELNHLAIVMDGNGRWAKSRALVRTNGHEVGAAKVEEIAIFCAGEGVKTLTLYAFSTENWKRPKTEVDFLMKLLVKFLRGKREMFTSNNIKFETIGDILAFPGDVQSEISNLKELTKDASGLNLVLALNYGGRDEIVRAARACVSAGEEISEENLSSRLDTARFGDVDLLVRTGGEQRLSNFLLWEASYAELAFTPTLWPDFTLGELAEIIAKYRGVKRRFGGL